MSINPVSFGKIFVIRYKKGKNTTQEQLDERMATDRRKLFEDYCDKNTKIQKIECRDDLCPDSSLRISQNGIRYFTDNSYKEYSMLKKIDNDAAEQYAAKEAIRLYIEV